MISDLANPRSTKVSKNQSPRSLLRQSDIVWTTKYRLRVRQMNVVSPLDCLGAVNLRIDVLDGLAGNEDDKRDAYLDDEGKDEHQHSVQRLKASRQGRYKAVPEDGLCSQGGGPELSNLTPGPLVADGARRIVVLLRIDGLVNLLQNFYFAD
jgi:hypothetical protein